MKTEEEIRDKWREVCHQKRQPGCRVDSGSFAIELVRWVEASATPLLATLVEIANYSTSDEGDADTTEQEFGLSVPEVIEMAHDNIILLARSAVEQSGMARKIVARK
jgi:hypothetical protein